MTPITSTTLSTIPSTKKQKSTYGYKVCTVAERFACQPNVNTLLKVSGRSYKCPGTGDRGFMTGREESIVEMLRARRAHIVFWCLLDRGLKIHWGNGIAMVLWELWLVKKNLQSIKSLWHITSGHCQSVFWWRSEAANCSATALIVTSRFCLSPAFQDNHFQPPSGRSLEQTLILVHNK